MRGARRVVVLLGLIASASAAPADPTVHAVFHPPQQRYLALGDSLAFGYQQTRFLHEELTGRYSAATFTTGYDADFAAMMQPPAWRTPGFTETNFACPGETTTSMVDGPCPFPYGLHDAYPAGDSQLHAAVAFLEAHPRSVNPITLDIGANDLLGMVEACHFDAMCIAGREPEAAATMAINLDTILTGLQAAAPDAEIIAMNVPDVFVFAHPATSPGFAAYNATLAAVVAAHRVRLVDAFSVVARMSRAQFCAAVAFCGPLHDIHPTDGGYAILASSFFASSGYAAAR